ncbi:insulin receptor substrate 1-B [Polypterus senegalus]|uniref:insulin receptor substrate 1-B n=1 Tax=Polypterus senegalus TaxID=55291 RepID=UPI0019660E8E|nr:insulin receptor substrate 1-B [Polypterus senegalus]
MEQQAPDPFYEDVRKCGYLRKQKSMHKRYFVLRGASDRGPARLECYENEKKFRAKAPVPKKALNLETCFNINKRADAKNKHLIVLYTREESFSIAAESDVEQQGWYEAMLQLQCQSKIHGENVEYGVATPGPAFKEVWQVKVWPKGLGQAKNLVGIYRLCLTDKTVNFVKLNSDAAAVVLQLMNVRRCGHSENFFFVEVGRSAVTGPGEFWMQVDDSVVAQNMHETLLEAMKALNEEFRQRSKSQSSSTSSNPITVPSRRYHPNPPPSQVGFSRKSRSETPNPTSNVSPTQVSKISYPRGRTSSDGSRSNHEEGSCGSPSNSCSTTPTLRPKSSRAKSSSKTVPNHVKSTPVCTAPSPAPSPASLSSSSGHGSECGAYARGVSVSEASVSGSLSDYGSSDESACSPGDAPLFHGHLASDLFNTCTLTGDKMADYITMGRRGGHSLMQHPPPPRRILRRSSSRDGEAERRLLSKRASLPPMSLEKVTPGLSRRHVNVASAAEEEGIEDDYAVMSRSTSRESFTRVALGGSYLDIPGNDSQEANRMVGHVEQTVDNGYMSMLPGVVIPVSGQGTAVDTNSKPDDYMSMTPNSTVSPPQQINARVSDGYMMMSPNSSCSPDQRGSTWGGHHLPGGGGSSVDSKTGSDYMNMSPVSSRSACSTPPEGLPLLPEVPKMVYSYYSLPRSYKHSSANFDNDTGKEVQVENSKINNGYLSRPRLLNRDVHSSHPATRLLSSSSFSSGSASSESLGEVEEHTTRGRFFPGSVSGTDNILKEDYKGVAGHSQVGKGSHRFRPVSLFVDVAKANTLPRVKVTPLLPEPKSPGEYVSIEFRDDVGVPARVLKRPTSCISGLHSSPIQPDHLGSEYVNMELGPPVTFDGYQAPLSGLVYEERNLVCDSRPKINEDPNPKFSTVNKTCGTASPLDSPSFGDYTEMAYSPGPKLPIEAPASQYAEEDHSAIVQPPLPILSHVACEFPLQKINPNPDQGAKVIRADPQGRRRHCSETFLAPMVQQPLLTHLTQSTASPFTDQSSKCSDVEAYGINASFDITNELAATPQSYIPSTASIPASASPPPSTSPSGEQGLNYIDLDLANKDIAHTALEGTATTQPPVRMFTSLLSNGGSTASTLNTYASIDFHKSEELRSFKSNGRESTDC